MQSKQTGVSLAGFIIILIVAAFFAFMAMKLVPPYMHYFGVEKAMHEMVTEGAGNKSAQKLYRDFMFKLSFQYADKAIQPDDVKFKRVGDKTKMDVAYDAKVHFLYNISFLLHFHKSVMLPGNTY